MRDIFTLFVFFAAIAATFISGGIMIHDLILPVFDGVHFAAASVSVIISAVFFWFVRDEVVF